jgi:hypothetical protein
VVEESYQDSNPELEQNVMQLLTARAGKKE